MTTPSREANETTQLLPLPYLPHEEFKVRAISLHAAQQYAQDYARANMAALAQRVAELEAEVERLTGCLATANANHETFERRWYLEKDRAERLAEALRLTMSALTPLHNAHMPSEREQLTDDDVEDAQKAMRAGEAALQEHGDE